VLSAKWKWRNHMAKELTDAGEGTGEAPLTRSTSSRRWTRLPASLVVIPPRTTTALPGSRVALTVRASGLLRRCHDAWLGIGWRLSLRHR
jgi:hypothetical protein